ncbi:MAG: F0F1 ATP synthase subunit A [Caldilineaceae bacterium]
MATEQTPGTSSNVPPTPQEPIATPDAVTSASATAHPVEAPAQPPLPEETALRQGLLVELDKELVAEKKAKEEAEGAKKGFFSNTRNLIGLGAVVVALIVGFFWPNVPEPHVVLGGEQISMYAPWWLTNSMLHTLIVDVLLIILALSVRFSLKLVPSGIQNFMEMIIEYFYGLAEQIAGKAARTYFPWIMTIFLFVIVSNWTGFFPGVGSIGVVQTHSEEHQEEGATEEESRRYPGQLAMADGNLILLTGDEMQAKAEEGKHFIPSLRAPTADLNVTFALAIVTMFMVQFWGFRALGFSYLRKFFNASGKGFMRGISAFVGILELISELSRILSFGFRLFGNIFAGEIVLATMAFLAAFILPLPFYLLETFVGFVQALVFTMLALVFFSMATVGHHDDSHAEGHH